MVTEDGVKISKMDSTSTSTSTGGSTTSGGGKTVLNGMDALCTAAAMMADTPGGEEDQGGVDQQSTVIETITLDGGEIVQPQGADEEVDGGSAGMTVTPQQRVNSAGDIVTYYHPVGPIHVVNRDGKDVQQGQITATLSAAAGSAATTTLTLVSEWIV